MDLQKDIYDVVPEISEDLIFGVLQAEDFILCFLGFMGVFIYKWKNEKTKLDKEGEIFNYIGFLKREVDDLIWDLTGGILLMLMLALASSEVNNFFSLGFNWSPAAPIICGLLGGYLMDKILKIHIKNDK